MGTLKIAVCSLSGSTQALIFASLLLLWSDNLNGNVGGVPGLDLVINLDSQIDNTVFAC